MNILILNDTFQERGATSLLVREEAHALKDRGHKVWILSTHSQQESEKIVIKDNIISIPRAFEYPSLRFWFGIWNPKVQKSLDTILQTIAVDVAHAHNIHTYLSFSTLTTLQKNHIPTLMTAHDVMSIAFGRIQHPSFLASKGTRTTSTLLNDIQQAGRRWNPWYRSKVRNIISQANTIVLPVSSALEKALHQHNILKTKVFHNRIDLESWDQRVQLSEQEEEKLLSIDPNNSILFGGRLCREKGFKVLLDAFRIVVKKRNNAQIIILGNEEVYKELLQESTALDLAPRIQCFGWVGREYIKHIYDRVSVVTTPSICLDTFNMMNLEAHASKKPVIGTCFGGTPDIVCDGNTGFICDPRDTEQYSKALLMLLENSEIRLQFGQNARQRVVDHFSLQKSMHILEKHMYDAINEEHSK